MLGWILIMAVAGFSLNYYKEYSELEDFSLTRNALLDIQRDWQRGFFLDLEVNQSTC